MEVVRVTGDCEAFPAAAALPGFDYPERAREHPRKGRRVPGRARPAVQDNDKGSRDAVGANDILIPGVDLGPSFLGFTVIQDEERFAYRHRWVAQHHA